MKAVYLRNRDEQSTFSQSQHACTHTYSTHCNRHSLIRAARGYIEGIIDCDGTGAHLHVKYERSMTHYDKHICCRLMDEWMHPAHINNEQYMCVFGCVNSCKYRQCHHNHAVTQLWKKELYCRYYPCYFVV